MQMPLSAALLSTWRFARSRLQRLQSGAAAGVVLLALAILCSDIENIPQHLKHAGEIGADAFLWHWLSKTLLSSFIVAAIALLVLRISAPNGRGMTDKPGRFFASLAVGTALGMAASWQVGFFLGRVPSLFAADMDWETLYSGWMNALLWGGLFGWMYFLYLRRGEDQARFGMLLGRRALLARQVAQSQIVAARAQVDPAMVVRILREIHTRYGHNVQSASMLMDHMIDYLRLALNRVRESQPTLARELQLLHAYIALRTAEAGQAIRLSSEPSAVAGPTGPVFLIAREMIDHAMQATHCALELQITTTAHLTTIALRLGGEPLTHTQFARLSEGIHARASGRADALQYLFAAAEHTYTVHVPIV